MGKNRRIDWRILIGILVVFTGMAYYGYKTHQRWINNGVYSVAQIDKIQIARNGWRVWISFDYRGEQYESDGIYFYEYFNLNAVGKRYFVKFLEKHPSSECGLIPILEVPDSIRYVPSEGWSEAWMQEHFPKVVEYVHDTR